jgi:hypothetical protein
VAGENVIEIVVRAQNQVGPGLAAAQTQVNSFAAGIRSLGAALAATGAVAFVIDTLTDSVKEFVKAEAGIRALGATLQTIGADVGRVTAEVEDMILAWERASTFDDDELRAGLTTLITITGDVTASGNSMQAAMDLSAARGMSLAAATEVVGRALEGNVLQLSRMGVKFSDADKAVFKYGTEVERAAVLTEAFATAMGGRAVAQMDSFEGKLKILQNSVGDLKEEIGGAMVSALVWFDELGKKVNAARDALDKYVNVWRIAATIVGRGPVAQRPHDANMGAFVFQDPNVTGGAGSQLHTSTAEAARASAAAAEAASKLKAFVPEIQKLNEEWRDLARNLAATPKGFEGNAASVVKLTDRILELGGSLTGTQARLRETAQTLLDSPQRDLHVQWFKALEGLDEQTDKWLRDMIAKFAKNPIALQFKPQPVQAANFAPIAAQFQKTLADAGNRGLEAMVEDFALTGGKNLSSIIEGFIAEGARAGAAALVDVLAEALRPGAAAKLERRPGESDADFAARQQAAGSDLAGRIVATVGLGIGGVQGIQANQQGRQNDTATIMQQVAVGASIGSIWPGIGTIIGAAVGLIIGGISAAFSSAGDQYKYGAPSIRRGQAAFVGGQNVSVREAEEIQQRMQATFNMTYDGFAKVLLKLQDFVPDFLRNMNITFTRGLESGGYIGRAASAHFMEHLERLITEGIPSEVGRQFKPVFAAAFESMGFTTERFNEIWGDLAEMDAQKSIQLLGQLADAVVSLKKSMAFFDTEVGGFDVRNQPLEGSLLAEAAARRQQSFAQSLRETDAEILRLSGHLDDLTTEGQIQTLGEIARLEEQRQQSILAFLDRVLAISEAVNASIESGIQELELRGLTDPQAKIDYLEIQNQRDRELLLAATSPEQAREISDRMYQRIFQIVDLGATLGPEAEAQYRQWGIDALRGLQGDFNATMNGLLQDVQDRNREFMDSWRPVYDRWMTELDSATTPLGGLGDEADRTRISFVSLTSAAEDAAGALRGVGAGGGGGETVIITGGDEGNAEVSAYVTDIRTRRSLA